MKDGCSKGKEPMIDLTSSPQRQKRSRSSPSDFNHSRFKSFAAYQSYLNNFKNAPLVLEHLVEQHTLSNTNIPQYFASKDWNCLMNEFDEVYESLVKEFYANAFFDDHEL